MKHLKTLENINTISATSCSCSYGKSMVNGGDLCLLNNVFPGFHISGVCSDVCSFNIIMCRFECFLQDLTEMLLRLLSSLYLPALCIMVLRDREQPCSGLRCIAQMRSTDSFLFRFVYRIALVNRA